MTDSIPQEDLRKSGLDIIGDVPWGTHFCQFFETKGDLANILVPYFKTGLENNEFCMWVTSEPLGVDDAKKELGRVVPNVENFIASGQLEIIPYTDWYYKGGSFDSERVLKGWVDKLERALEKGYAGLRLTGNTFWLEKTEWEDFTEYEQVVDSVIKNYRMLALCSYSVEKCNADEVIDVVANHQFALIKKRGRWELIESAERKKMTEELKASEEKYRTLFESMLNGFALHEIILDEDGKPRDYRFLEINRAFEELTGLKRENLIGKTVLEVLPGTERYWIETYGGVALTGKPARFENYSRELDRYYEVFAYSPRKGVFATMFADITARKSGEEALKRSRDELEMLVADRTRELVDSNTELIEKSRALEAFFTHSITPMAFLDRRFNFIRVNAAYAGADKRSPDDFIGHNHFEFYPSDAKPIFEEVVSTKKPYFVFARPFTYADHPERGVTYWDWTLFPVLDYRGEVDFLVFSLNDVTERVRAEDELKKHRDHLEELVNERTDELQKLNERLVEQALKMETINKELEAFSYSVSHDLRVPLRAIDGFARILKDEYRDRLPEEGRHYLQTICDSSRQMGKLIDDLLTLSRIGRQELAKQKVEPAFIIRQVLSELGHEVEGRAISIHTGDLRPCNADPVLLKQVFLNLLANAFKFTRKRDVAVIEIGCIEKDGKTVYFVKDNGVGFDMAFADKLFGVFQRLHRPDEYEGTGVGLAIVKRIIDRHGGAVWAQAEVDQGATFYFHL